MNGAINKVTAADVAAVKQQATVPKEQTPDGGRFKNMLSDAVNSEVNSSPKDTVKPQKTVENPDTQENPVKTGPHAQETERTKPQEQSTVQDEQEEDDVQAYARQAAMQMQFIAPVIADSPQPDIPDGTETVEATGFQPVQSTETAIPAETPLNTGELSLQAQELPAREVKQPDETERKPQAPIDTQARQGTPIEAAVEQVMGQAAGTARQGQTARTDSPRTGHNRPTAKEDPELTAGITEADVSDITDVQIIRQHQAVQMHNMRRPPEDGAAQSRFDSMLAKASKELNPNAAEPQAEGIPEETPLMEQAGTLTEPQEAAGQLKIPGDKIPEAEIKPQEGATHQEEAKPQGETKPAEQADVQKNEKTPVTEQHRQKETAKIDEAALGMVQPKQPESIQDVIRSEPAQQPKTEQAQAPEQAEQIRAQVIKSMENQRTEFQMQLNPEELGKINVKMILEGGKLSVEIMALNPKSAELLSKQAESLAASLKTGSIEVSTVNVVTAAENASANMNSEYNLNNFQNQFRNQQDNQEQGRHSGHTGTSQVQAASGETVREKSQTPKRILNYSV